MEDEIRSNQPTGILKITIWIFTITISGYYILSAAGWFSAAFILLTGNLDQAQSTVGLNFSILDHIIRVSQVVLITAASVFLILSKNMALKLFRILILINLFSLLFVGKWVITFLGSPLALLILLAVYCYVYFLNARGFLR